MHSVKFSKTIILAAMALCLFGAVSASANVSISGSGAAWQAQKADSVLTVSGPNGTFTLDFAAGETPFLNAAELADGTYSWELKANAQKRDRSQAVTRATAAPTFGTFTVADGSFADPNLAEGANKAQVFATDLIVEGSACVGIDCTTTESFGFDTLRLKENNLRIKFEDTSASANFPGNDWQLTANDSSNGGAERFSIEDTTNNKNIFTVEANAPNNSLYVDSSGSIGFGTNNPNAQIKLHAVDGNTPTLRLEQDGSDGFQSQTWDLAGNETNFFVRDVTNGSKLPFKIIPGAATDSLYVAASGNVGIGHANPTEKLHVKSGNALIEGPGVKLNLTDNTDSANTVNWFLQSDNASKTLLISKSGSGGGEIRIDDRQDGGTSGVTFFVDGSIQATNVTFSSTRSKKADFESVDPQDVLTRLNGIDIQTWRYKTEDESIRHMGPIAEDFADAFELGKSNETITVTDVNGVALAAIQALSQQIETLREQNLELQERLSDIEGR